VDVLGPVDYLVIEFPLDQANFSGEAAKELASLVDRGLIRVLDLIFLMKDEEGNLEVAELSELDEYGADALNLLDEMALQLLAEDDVYALAEAVERNSIAAVLVYENTWAGPFASALRRAGGQLVAQDRIPVQAILAALEADEAV
jgi:hypothetical protein